MKITVFFFKYELYMHCVFVTESIARYNAKKESAMLHNALKMKRFTCTVSH